MNSAAIELLEAELSACNKRAAELRCAIDILIRSGEKTTSNLPAQDIAVDVLSQEPDGLAIGELLKRVREAGGKIRSTNSMNTIMNRHVDLFMRHPVKRRNWTLRNRHAEARP